MLHLVLNDGKQVPSLKFINLNKNFDAEKYCSLWLDI